MDDFIARMNHEQNVRDGLVAKAPPRAPSPEDMDKFKGCDSTISNAIGVFLMLTGIVFLVTGAT